jgi:hypothetical protein
MAYPYEGEFFPEDTVTDIFQSAGLFFSKVHHL